MDDELGTARLYLAAPPLFPASARLKVKHLFPPRTERKSGHGLLRHPLTRHVTSDVHLALDQ